MNAMKREKQQLYHLVHKDKKEFNTYINNWKIAKDGNCGSH
jgi:uncharacterized protein YijF (DUF1287 family)